jgi:hypothetical protein
MGAGGCWKWGKGYTGGAEAPAGGHCGAANGVGALTGAGVGDGDALPAGGTLKPAFSSSARWAEELMTRVNGLGPRKGAVGSAIGFGWEKRWVAFCESRTG